MFFETLFSVILYYTCNYGPGNKYQHTKTNGVRNI